MCVLVCGCHVYKLNSNFMQISIRKIEIWCMLLTCARCFFKFCFFSFAGIHFLYPSSTLTGIFLPFLCFRRTSPDDFSSSCQHTIMNAFHKLFSEFFIFFFRRGKCFAANNFSIDNNNNFLLRSICLLKYSFLAFMQHRIFKSFHCSVFTRNGIQIRIIWKTYWML